jgi:hypothetical protein
MLKQFVWVALTWSILAVAGCQATVDSAFKLSGVNDDAFKHSDEAQPQTKDITANDQP